MTWKIALVIGGLGILMLLISLYLERSARRARAGRPVDEEAMRAEVAAALDRDDLAKAVKIYRQRTGARLLPGFQAVQRIDRDRR